MEQQTGQTAPQPRGRDLMMRRTLDAINQHRPDWTGWWEALSPTQKGKYRQIEQRVDAAYLAGDKDGMTAALDELYWFCVNPDSGDLPVPPVETFALPPQSSTPPQASAPAPTESPNDQMTLSWNQDTLFHACPKE